MSSQAVDQREAATPGAEHAGSRHAADAGLALQAARDTCIRRGEGELIWGVPSAAITASDPGDTGPLFEPGTTKPDRHPSFDTAPATRCRTRWGIL